VLKELNKSISQPSFFKPFLQLSAKGKIETNAALMHAIAAYVAISMPPLAPLPMGVLLGFALGKTLCDALEMPLISKTLVTCGGAMGYAKNAAVATTCHSGVG